MGLDFFDITYRIEKTFRIDFSNDDLMSLVRNQDITVGDLYDMVLKKMHLQDIGRYDIRLNRQFWLQMQSILHSATNVPSSQLELGLSLETPFPRPTRRDAWHALRAACPYRIPDLDYPHVVRISGLCLAAGVVLVEQFQIWQLPVINWLWPLLGLLGFWMFGETYLKIMSICAPLRNRFPSGMKSVKDLCRLVLAMNYADICNSVDIPLDQRHLSVWHNLVEVLADVLGVNPDEVTFRSRIVRDLGAQ
jgi:hypothetical protein